MEEIFSLYAVSTVLHTGLHRIGQVIADTESVNGVCVLDKMQSTE